MVKKAFQTKHSRTVANMQAMNKSKGERHLSKGQLQPLTGTGEYIKAFYVKNKAVASHKPPTFINKRKKSA
jgi:hypothetical protein